MQTIHAAEQVQEGVTVGFLSMEFAEYFEESPVLTCRSLDSVTVLMSMARGLYPWAASTET